jgi:hypothetical protein
VSALAILYHAAWSALHRVLARRHQRLAVKHIERARLHDERAAEAEAALKERGQS